MILESKYLEIQHFLSIPNEKFKLNQKIDLYFDSEDMKIEILSKILLFIHKFSMFKDIIPFMESVYQCIENTIEIKIDALNDFNELLIKNSLMQFIQNYIDYAQLSQKRQIVRLLSDSLDRLQVQPLIINLGLLLKPMYQDVTYLENLKKLKEIEIRYTLDDEIEKTIKTDIDNWLRINLITLENQNQFRDELLEFYDFLIEKYAVSTESQRSLKLKTEVLEMFSMKLTMLSLMEIFIDESIEPLPIK